MVRCFIGVFLPDFMITKVIELQNFIKTLAIECKLVEAENLHLTLSFLGEKSETEVVEIKDNLDEVCKNFESFPVTISGIKLIPSRNYVRVIVLDATDNSGVLVKLADGIKNKIGGDVKPPHLTLCRVMRLDNNTVISKLLNFDSFCGEFQLNSVQLIESKLSGHGPSYDILHESKLK